jgi:hypothetical protein
VKLPTVQQAEAFLAEAARLNAGPWVEHSRVVARAAQAIAARHPELDPPAAYVFGLLHDIGRRSGGPGVPDVRHILDGYAFLRQQGFEDAAQICLTHSFPIKDADAFASPWGDLAAERRFVQDYLQQVVYSSYDHLIQVCDSLSLPTGPCLMEKRLVDVAMRHGFNRLTLAKWQAYFELRRAFDAAVGGSIYALLPGVVEQTFGWQQVAPAPDSAG